MRLCFLVFVCLVAILSTAASAMAAAERSLLDATDSPDGRYRLERRAAFSGSREQRLVLHQEATGLRRDIYAFQGAVMARWSPDSAYLFINDDSDAASAQCVLLRLSDLAVLPLHDMAWRALHPQAAQAERYSQSYRCADWQSADRIVIHENSRSGGRHQAKTITWRVSFGVTTSDLQKSCGGETTAAAPPLNAVYASLRRRMPGNDWRPLVTRDADGMPLEGPPVELMPLERDFWSNGMREVHACAGTGSSSCQFDFQDRAGNRLTVITEGENWKFARIRATRITCATKAG